MKNFTLLILFFMGSFQLAQSQDRYLDDVFTDVTVTENVIYGVNATIAPFFYVEEVTEAVPRPLNADIYTPDGDTESDRPLVILFHTGNFLPLPLNGGCAGTVKDPDMVNFATRLAKKGYVVAVADYRIGWNPLADNETTRAFLLINAAYRGVQDSRTAVKYFKRTVAEQNNPYGIDPSKIAMWGFGTGGYITYGSAFLDVVQDTWIPKFTTPAGPMVFAPINGDINVDAVGIAPEGYLGLPAGDTLCYPNHVGYSGDFHFAAASGGALGDTSWIDADDIPFVAFQVPTDPFAPCGTDILIVPNVNFNVVEVMGSCTSMPYTNNLGNNDVFDVPWVDEYTARANAASGGVSGFFPFTVTPDLIETESAPWNYNLTETGYGVTQALTGMAPDCPTDVGRAQIYADSMMAYWTPRACLALDLGCNLTNITSTVNIDATQVGLEIMPNPASVDVRFEAKQNIQSIYVYDLTGRLVKAHTDINGLQFTMPRNNLANGLYVAQVRFENGFVTQKLSFN